MTKTRLALFDLDHTLIPIDSDYSWGQFTVSLGWTDPVEFTRLNDQFYTQYKACLLYTSPSPRDRTRSRMPSSA